MAWTYAELKVADPGGDDLVTITSTLNAQTVLQSQLVSRGDLRQKFDNLVNASGMPVWEAIDAEATAQTPVGIACRAAIRLRDAPGDYPPINMAAKAMTDALAGLVAAGILSVDQQTDILAMGTISVPKWQPAVTAGDIQTARAQP